MKVIAEVDATSPGLVDLVFVQNDGRERAYAVAMSFGEARELGRKLMAAADASETMQQQVRGSSD